MNGYTDKQKREFPSLSQHSASQVPCFMQNTAICLSVAVFLAEHGTLVCELSSTSAVHSEYFSL
jgi:hypothetical protein